MANDEIERILSIVTETDPEQGFETIYSDLEQRLRARGLNENAMEGIRIAMQIAFRLGERAGINKMMDAREER